MLVVEILETVLEQKRVGLQLLNGEDAAFDPVLVHENYDVLEMVREHVGLVAGRKGIEEERLAVGYDPGRLRLLFDERVPGFVPGSPWNALVTAAQNSDAASAGAQGPRKLFHDRRFAGP